MRHIKQINVYIESVPGEERQKGAERTFEEITAAKCKSDERYEYKSPKPQQTK